MYLPRKFTMPSMRRSSATLVGSAILTTVSTFPGALQLVEKVLRRRQHVSLSLDGLIQLFEVCTDPDIA